MRTYGQIKANVSPETRQARAATRDTINSSLDGNRGMEANETLAIFQKVLASDVDFAGAKDYDSMLREAKRQLEDVYARYGDNPSTENLAKARWSSCQSTSASTRR